MVNHIFNNILIYIIILCVIILYNSYNIIFKIKTIEKNITGKNKKNNCDKINKANVKSLNMHYNDKKQIGRKGMFEINLP